jgi:hypothetical protein
MHTLILVIFLALIVGSLLILATSPYVRERLYKPTEHSARVAGNFVLGLMLIAAMLHIVYPPSLRWLLWGFPPIFWSGLLFESYYFVRSICLLVDENRHRKTLAESAANGARGTLRVRRRSQSADGLATSEGRRLMNPKTTMAVLVVSLAFAGCGESPVPQETSPSVAVDRQEADAERAKAALIALVRGNPGLFEGHPDPDKLQGLPLEESESGT